MIPVLSLWQPYASLAIHDYKHYETRGWRLPDKYLGIRFAIASTKTIKPEQVKVATSRKFLKHFRAMKLGWNEDIRTYPLGCILGTVVIESCTEMTPEFIKSVGQRERVFGIWRKGRFAFKFTEHRVFYQPIPVRGQQGIWFYHGEIAP